MHYFPIMAWFFVTVFAFVVFYREGGVEVIAAIVAIAAIFGMIGAAWRFRADASENQGS